MNSPEPPAGQSRRRWPLILAVAAILLEAIGMRQRGSHFGRNVIVRCRQGHLFTTIWIPAASFKSLRLGGRRVQRCPVGRHWSLVTPVRESDLTEEQQREAREHHDIQIP